MGKWFSFKKKESELPIEAALAKISSLEAELEEARARHDAEVEFLRNDLAVKIKDNTSLNRKVFDLTNRNQKLEEDARAMGIDGILMKAHEISKDTKVLIISTPNASLVNHGTYANFMNRLQNICKTLDVVALIHGNLSIEQMTSREDFAEKYNSVAIPRFEEWTERRDKILEEVAILFDRFAVR